LRAQTAPESNWARLAVYHFVERFKGRSAHFIVAVGQRRGQQRARIDDVSRVF
jgi:hypothetical protein